MHVGSKGAYLPQWATIEEATSWLEAVTGESWPQARLLESGHFLSLGVWWRPGDSAPPEWMHDVFEGQTQGFWAPITSKSDVAALAVDRTLVFTQTRTPSGKVVDFHHGMMFDLTGLRIEGRSLRALIGALKPENAHITSWVIVPPGVSEFAYDRLGEILADASGCPNECAYIEATRGNHFQGIINTRVSGGEVVLHDARTGEPIHISDDAGGDGSVIGLHDLKTLLATPFWFGEERFCFGVLAPQAFEIQKDPETEKTPIEADSQAASVAATEPGLPTSQVAEAFSFVAGLKAKLGDVNNHQWLLPARLTQGRKPNPATWCPLRLAEILLSKGKASESDLSRAFVMVAALRPWRDSWQEAKRERNAFGR